MEHKTKMQIKVKIKMNLLTIHRNNRKRKGKNKRMRNSRLTKQIKNNKKKERLKYSIYKLDNIKISNYIAKHRLKTTKQFNLQQVLQYPFNKENTQQECLMSK